MAARAICVVGSGAIGSMIAALLSRAGHELHMVARGAQLAALTMHGLTLRQPDGSCETVPVNACDGTNLPPQQVIFLTVKAHQIALLVPLLQQLRGENTILVPVINGVPWWYFTGHHQHSGRVIEAVDPGGALLRQLAGPGLVGAVAYAMAERPVPGEVLVRGPAALSVGLADAAVLETLAGLSVPGLAITPSASIRGEVWSKLLGNLSSNPLSVITGAGLRTLYTNETLLPQVRAVMNEVACIATALGDPPGKSPETLLRLGAAAGDFPTSMLQDFRARRPLELSALGDAALELAILAGVSAPVLATHVGLVQFLSHAQEAHHG